MFALFIFILLISACCASVSKKSFNHKKTESSCNISQLVGDNTLFYSHYYQRSLKKSLKKIGVR
jgi:hypothetical protein